MTDGPGSVMGGLPGPSCDRGLRTSLCGARHQRDLFRQWIDTRSKDEFERLEGAVACRGMACGLG